MTSHSCLVCIRDRQTDRTEHHPSPELGEGQGRGPPSGAAPSPRLLHRGEAAGLHGHIQYIDVADSYAAGIKRMSAKAERYWQQFLATLPPDAAQPAKYTDVFYFGIVPEDALPVLEPVLQGTKTATGSLLWTYEAEGKPVPRAGDHAIATDGYDNPMCIIETVDVQVIPYDEVGEDYAWEGGERDRTLASWRALYWDYIVGECQNLGREPSPKTPLVMERFRVVYREPLRED